MSVLRVIIVDDERPARLLLAGLLRQEPDVQIVGQAADGREARRLMTELRPDLALLDLEMPGGDGLTAVRQLHERRRPLVAFVTAHDSHALRAFHVDAIDYLLKPVEPHRLRETLRRARERLEQVESLPARPPLRLATDPTPESPTETTVSRWLKRIPVHQQDEVLLVPIERVAVIEADADGVIVTTVSNERFPLPLRLKELEARLEPGVFFRLSRGTLVQSTLIHRVKQAVSGTGTVMLITGHRHAVSRIRMRVLRTLLLEL